MTVGIVAANLANKWLDMLAGTAFTAPAGAFVKLHTGDPGAAGTSNVSAVTTRVSCAFSAASAGSKALSASPTAWSMTATETITHISFWDAVTAGTILFTAVLATPKSVINTDTLQLTTLTISFTPVAV